MQTITHFLALSFDNGHVAVVDIYVALWALTEPSVAPHIASLHQAAIS